MGLDDIITKRKLRAGLYGLYVRGEFVGLAEKKASPADGGWAIHAWTEQGLEWLSHTGDTMAEAIHDMRVHRRYLAERGRC